MIAAKKFRIWGDTMNKDEKRKALAEYKRRQKEAFLASLPMPEECFRELFDHLDERLGEVDCRHDLRLTESFLADQDCDPEAVIDWLVENGGSCDCEVLANIEEKFEH